MLLAITINSNILYSNCKQNYYFTRINILKKYIYLSECTSIVQLIVDIQ